ncbi:MAG TPA: DUF6292 family protein [Pseudonocardiaceae bacterium]|jgi:hypothetical protein|nr:DUF6292 family protein [Pseudonocardiaceae bacterium]
MAIGPAQLVAGPWADRADDEPPEFDGMLREYVYAVAAGWRIGAEFCVLDMETPAWAYVALDWELPRYPNRDLALLWDERTGWSVAIETHSSEDLIVVACPNDPAVVPPPARVCRFVDRLTRHGGWAGRRDPSAWRPPGRHQELATRMAGVLALRPVS